MQNLRDRQIQALSKMLTLSSSYAQHGAVQLYLSKISMLLTNIINTYSIRWSFFGEFQWSMEGFNIWPRLQRYNISINERWVSSPKGGHLTHAGWCMDACMHETVMLIINPFSYKLVAIWKGVYSWCSCGILRSTHRGEYQAYHWRLW